MMGWARALLLLAVANAGTSPEGRTWLEAKAKEDGVVTLESGLMYKVLRDGDGEAHPKASTSCECHYEGKLIDGTVFDSSYERGSPTSFAPNQVIKGWTEAMQLMVEGDKWEMYPVRVRIWRQRLTAQDPRRRAARLPDGDFEH